MQPIDSGDKVSFLNDRLTGTVLRRLDKNRVLVSLDDGFEIPANVSELVVLQKAAGSKERIGETPQKEKLIAEVQEKKEELGLAFMTESFKLGKPEVKAYLVNTTPYIVLYAIYIGKGGRWINSTRGELMPSEAVPVGNFLLEQADEYRNWRVQILRCMQETDTPPAPITEDVRLRPAALLKDAADVPVIRKPGLWIAFGQQGGSESAKPAKATSGPAGGPAFTHVEGIGEVVDLHIDELDPAAKDLSADAIFGIQVHHFRNALEKALAFRMEKVIFIHGIGNGRLKKEIRRVLSTEPAVKRFEDADPKKFGYGATSVYLKSS